MNGLNGRPVAAALDWITSFKGFFISLLVYGVIELALYAFFDSSRIVTADRSEGWFDRLEYPAGSFRGTYLYLMQVSVTALYVIAFARRIFFAGKSIVSGEFDFKMAVLGAYLNVRRFCAYFVMPHTYIALIAGIVFFAAAVGSRSADTLLLPFAGVSFMQGYEYLLKDVIFNGIWGGLGGLEWIISAVFLHIMMTAVIAIEGVTPLHRYLVERGYVTRLQWRNF